MKPRLPSDLSLAELFFEVLKLNQCALATAFLFCRRTAGAKATGALGAGSGLRRTRLMLRSSSKRAQLEQIESLRALTLRRVWRISFEVAALPDQVGESEAGAQELKPEPLPVKTPGEVLTGETAVGLVQLLHLRSTRCRWSVHGASRVTQGRSSSARCTWAAVMARVLRGGFLQGALGRGLRAGQAVAGLRSSWRAAASKGLAWMPTSWRRA